MSYKISPGITEHELAAWLKKAAKRFGTFDDSRVDYTNADIAPIILCVIASGDEFLLLKRGYGLADAEGYWSVTTGFIDEAKPIKAQIKQEIKEETGLMITDQDIKLGQSYTLQNPQEKRRYIIFPSLVRLPTKPKIVLDHEHTNQAWITKSELKNFHILDDLPYAIEAAFAAKR